MAHNNPWSRNGVAGYPPRYPMVGQNRIFNGLWKFKQGFGGSDRMTGFFVVVGDWGLGKTRLGYELVAETTGRVDEWFPSNGEYVVPNAQGRILAPQVQEGILPLFVDYWSCIPRDDSDWGSDVWVSRVTCTAIELLWNRPPDLRVSPELLDDMVAVLTAKGVDLAAVRKSMAAETQWKAKLDAAMAILRAKGVESLWVVVDEVEMPGDQKQNPDFNAKFRIDIEDLNLISVVIKERRYREDHPYVNFLLLCSLGMADTINIGPNIRRSDLVLLEPNQIADVLRFREVLKDRGEEVDYPGGTLEGAFVATNRNFGWFNKMMSSVHASWAHHKRSGSPRPEAWQLIEEYANSEARASEIFNLKILQALPVANQPVAKSLIFGQLPKAVGPQFAPELASQLSQSTLPGVGVAFAPLRQVHIDASTLRTELLGPEYGFKPVPSRAGDDVQNRYTEFSVAGVLSALRAFSVAVAAEDDGDFVIYEDLEQFADQLATLYPRRSAQGDRTIERAADPLHRVFLKCAVSDKRFLGVSFKLLKQIDVRMGSESRSIAFSRDPQLNERIDAYVAEQCANAKRRQEAICRGMAKVLDDSRADLRQVSGLDQTRHVAFEHDLSSPQMAGLAVTPTGRVTVAYCVDVREAAKELAAMLGRTGEIAHPILVLMGADGDVDGFQAEAARKPLLARCVTCCKLSVFDEEFLLRYSGRDDKFDQTAVLTTSTLSTRESLRQDLAARFTEWRKTMEEGGFVLRPLWYRKTAGIEDFHRGYRIMMAEGKTIDQITPEIPGTPFTDNQLAYGNLENACKKLTSPGPMCPAGCLPVMTPEPYAVHVCPELVRVLQAMRGQTGESQLAKQFLYAAREPDGRKQTLQVVELLVGLGVVTSPVANQYKAVNSEALNERRTKVANWLATTANELIHDIQDVFPAEAEDLRKGAKQMAEHHLGEADQVAQRINTTFLQEEVVDVDAFKRFVCDVYEFEAALARICPEDPYSEFVIQEGQVQDYQRRYQSLPFWAKLHFLRWLRLAFARERQAVGLVIDEQLADVQDYAQSGEHSFPIAPLTQPLKCIKAELDNAIGGAGGSVRDFIKFPEYPVSIEAYLHNKDYAVAWGRLKALRGLATKNASEGLWGHFVGAHKSWEAASRTFAAAKVHWEGLVAFMADSPPEVRSEAAELQQQFEGLQDQVEGGLKHLLDQHARTVKGVALLERLVKEVESAVPAFGGIERGIREFREHIEAGLKRTVSDDRLQALNQLLRATKAEEWMVPPFAATYGKTKKAFDGFNVEVSQRGRELLEGSGRKTNWELWTEVFVGLRAGQYRVKPELSATLDELEQMQLIERTVRLK